jgi:hypothetical protein
MNVHISENETSGNRQQPVITCSCGARILLIPNVKLMSEVIEAHVETHKLRVNDPAAAEVEGDQIRDELIAKVLERISNLKESKADLEK